MSYIIDIPEDWNDISDNFGPYNQDALDGFEDEKNNSSTDYNWAYDLYGFEVDELYD